jgi:hypothetical protein
MKRLKKHVARKIMILGRKKILKPKEEKLLQEFLDKVNK